MIGPTAPSYLVVYPPDATRPLAANLNWLAGDPPLSNAVTVDVSADGRISFYNLAGSVNIAVDVVAYLVDHHHDDGYYTRAQVDALLTAAKDDVWGYVISNGGIHAGSGNFTVTKPAVGQYCIVVSKRLSHKVAQATLADPGGTSIVSVGTGHGSACNPLITTTHDAIPVFVKTPANAAIDGNFTIFIPAP